MVSPHVVNLCPADLISAKELGPLYHDARTAKHRDVPSSGPRRRHPGQIELDGFRVLAASDLDLPEDVYAADVSLQNIEAIQEADIRYFRNLRVLRADGNQLARLACLTGLESLQSLSLSCNLIRITEPLPADCFPHLTLLDLSYNRLTASCFQHLTVLQGLQSLDLSGNDLSRLRQGREVGRKEAFMGLHSLMLNQCCLRTMHLQFLSPFQNLQSLSLADNFISKLSWTQRQMDVDASAIDMCCPLPNLKDLDLSGNPLTARMDIRGLDHIPTLRLGNTPLWTHTRLSKQEQYETQWRLSSKSGPLRDSKTSGISECAEAQTSNKPQGDLCTGDFYTPVPALKIRPQQFYHCLGRIMRTIFVTSEGRTFYQAGDICPPRGRPPTRGVPPLQSKPEACGLSTLVPPAQYKAEALTQDPTIWAATQLGLDPAHLAIRNGALGGNAQAAICSLRSVLQNCSDCWDTEGQGVACLAFAKPTISASHKRSAIKPKIANQPPNTLSPKKFKIAKIEQILLRLRQRLERVEAEVSSMVAPIQND